MSRDHHAVGYGAGAVVERPLSHAQGFEALPGDGIVDELAQDGQRLVGGEAFGQRERVAHAKANAVMFSEMDGHGIGVRCLCGTKYQENDLECKVFALRAKGPWQASPSKALGNGRIGQALKGCEVSNRF